MKSRAGRGRPPPNAKGSGFSASLSKPRRAAPTSVVAPRAQVEMSGPSPTGIHSPGRSTPSCTRNSTCSSTPPCAPIGRPLQKNLAERGRRTHREALQFRTRRCYTYHGLRQCRHEGEDAATLRRPKGVFSREREGSASPEKFRNPKKKKPKWGRGIRG